MKPKIAIACQGGGSQTAFTAGALQGLFDARVQDEFEIVSLSGTSGGAICAALIWYALKKGDDAVSARLMEFWTDNTAQTPAERTFNDFVVGSLRMANQGMLPVFQTSPASAASQSMLKFATMGQRREYSDFDYLLRRHINFEELANWGPQTQGPVLVLGAASVLSGQLAKFNSSKTPIRVEHILASCCVPSIFPAVEFDGDAYWDGLFSDNPPLDDLVRPSLVGIENIPREIWLIKINPTRSPSVPTKPAEIIDRRNQLEGNVSVKQNLKYIELMNDLIVEGAFKDEFLDRLDFREPVRIPKAFRSDADKAYHIPFIEMSETLQNELNYESKIDRSERNIQKLIADGRAQAQAFLAGRRGSLQPVV